AASEPGPWRINLYAFGECLGIARMGQDAQTSVLNAFNQMHEVPNLFITDGSCMTSGACLNPSLTYMALTARACDHAVR
ncbi:MAG: GMC oxidoreductase, partial [Chitinophaga rupis]